ncbi:MAG: DNA gyrase inhibitor YacG [Planctomycetaceae bacterium]|nr:DNA gyrase inhibitor YacG [Planctomycetaceae bacterium]
MDFRCPVCQKAVPSPTTRPDGKKTINASHFPFCSRRCRLIDLGAWLNGDYGIPVEQESPPDEVSGDSQ